MGAKVLEKTEVCAADQLPSQNEHSGSGAASAPRAARPTARRTGFRRRDLGAHATNLPQRGGIHVCTLHSCSAYRRDRRRSPRWRRPAAASARSPRPPARRRPRGASHTVPRAAARRPPPPQPCRRRRPIRAVARGPPPPAAAPPPPCPRPAAPPRHPAASPRPRPLHRRPGALAAGTPERHRDAACSPPLPPAPAVAPAWPVAPAAAPPPRHQPLSHRAPVPAPPPTPAVPARPVPGRHRPRGRCLSTRTGADQQKGE